MNKFWLDPSYAKYNSTPIPLKLETLYQEPAELYVIVVLFGLLVAVFLPIIAVALISSNQDRQSAIPSTRTVVRCMTIADQKRSIQLIVSYRRSDGSLAEAPLIDPPVERDCALYPVGTQLQIGVKTGAPDTLYMTDPRPQFRFDGWSSLILALLVLGVFSILGVLYGVDGLRRYNRKKAEYKLLKKRGLITEGVIIGAEWIPSGNKFAMDIEVSYTFRLPDGKEATGRQRVRHRDFELFARPADGTPVTILYVDENVHCAL